ncbi:hypothetical protein [Nocardiopsis ganjiahuensis]|uniref:hypothetical protein n=1 Tax=Nocardiopsis ganjiahuensis TaxID=239984 RepID=UPI0003483FB9|nr:hypothetical protein [Nocardiopsis ganjiahuensis]
MSRHDHREQVTDDDLTSFLLELSNSERRQLLTLVATRLEPKAIIGPLTEGVTEALGGGPGEDLTGAEIKDAVRRALIENMQARRTHLAQLAQLSQLAEEKGRHDVLARKIADFRRATGLKKVMGTEDLSLFRVVSGSPETGEYAAVLRPAFVDETDGRLVVAGEVEFSDVPPVKDPGRDEEKAICTTCGNPMKGRGREARGKGKGRRS